MLNITDPIKHKSNSEIELLHDNFILKTTNGLTEPFNKLQAQIHTTLEDHCAGILTPHELSHRLTIAENLCIKINKLIIELADLSVAGTDQEMQLHLQETNLVDIAADVLEELMDLAISKRCQLSFHAPEIVMGEWDVLKMHKLFSHLILNGIIHGSRSAIEVRISSTENYAHLEVKDSGPGIPLDMQAKIFERFTKVDDTSENFGNGLWLVKEIVERFRGRLQLVSSPEEGTSFFIDLPLKQQFH